MVSTPDRHIQRKLCHINMLKEYCTTREDESVSKSTSVAPVALLTVTDGNSSQNSTEDDLDL